VTGKQESKLTGKEASAAAAEEDKVIGKKAGKRLRDEKNLVDVGDSKKKGKRFEERKMSVMNEEKMNSLNF
jgi:hypothetical protein